MGILFWQVARLCAVLASPVYYLASETTGRRRVGPVSHRAVLCLGSRLAAALAPALPLSLVEMLSTL